MIKKVNEDRKYDKNRNKEYEAIFVLNPEEDRQANTGLARSWGCSVKPVFCKHLEVPEVNFSIGGN